MGVNKLFWCNNCQTFTTEEDAEILTRPNGWSRVEIQGTHVEILHFCTECTDKLRAALAIFFKRRPQ